MSASRPIPRCGGQTTARSGVRPWGVLVLCASLIGCAGGQFAQVREGAVVPPQSPEIQAGMDEGEPPSARPGMAPPPGDESLSQRRFSRDGGELRTQVADVCRQFGEFGDPARLRLLVGALYASGVDPGAAAEAMRRARCAEPAEIVFEMVGQGGEASLGAVAAQFQGVRDPTTRKRIASALADGLARYAGETAARVGEVAEQTPAYGMLYLPSVGDSARWDSAIALNRLYEDAIPGYGLYTFVLLGRGSASHSPDETNRYRELFRVLETYVAGAEQTSGQPNPESHVFLIPIKLGEQDAPLSDQVAGDLSDHMRLVLASDLRQHGQDRLAARLERATGPFLVSTPEPHLMPEDSAAPRLVADLSALGPEYIYGVVDAYDRAVPAAPGGQARRLKALLDRLREIPVMHLEPAPAAAPDGDHKGRDDWLFPLGRFTAVVNGRPSLDLSAPALAAPEPTPAGGASSYT